MINTGTASPRLDLLGPILNEGFTHEAYIAHKILAPLPVQKRRGAVPSFLLTNDQTLTLKRGPRGTFKRITSQLGEKYFNCTDSGIEEALDHNDYETLGEDAAQMAVGSRLVHNVLRARDAALAAATLSAAGETTFAGQITTAGATWDTTGDPYANVADAQEQLVRRIGMPANALFMGYGVLTKLKKNAKIQSNYRALVGLGGGRVEEAINLELDPKILASIFGVEQVIIGGGIVNTANQGQAASRNFIWPSNYAGLARISKGGESANETAFGRMFSFDLAYDLGELATGTRDDLRALMLEEYREEQSASDILRCRDHVDLTFLVPEAFQIIKSI